MEIKTEKETRSNTIASWDLKDKIFKFLGFLLNSLVYIFCGILMGYTTNEIYKRYPNLEEWKQVIIYMSAVMFFWRIAEKINKE